MKENGDWGFGGKMNVTPLPFPLDESFSTAEVTLKLFNRVLK